MGHAMVLSRLARVVAAAVVVSCIATSAVAQPPVTPEIDPGNAASAITLLLGSLALLQRRRA